MTGQKLILNGLRLILWGATMVALGEPVSPDVGKTAEESVTLTENEIKLPGITINRETLEVRIEATVCLDSGILEYVVCRPNTFEHEAIFTTGAKPELVHAALLLGGLKPTPQLPGLAELWWAKALKQEDSRVRIEVEWKDEGVIKRVNLTSMLRNREETGDDHGGANPVKEVAEVKVQDAWIFAGSFIHTNKESGVRVYTANLSGILVGIWPDPSTVIQYGVANGNPYEGEHQGLAVNEDCVPKVGTKVNLIFSRYAPPQEKDSSRK